MSTPRGDGDGWVFCDHGHKHWGHFGAAGLLLRRVSAAGGVEVLLQHRAAWSHHGDTWGLPGGARNSDESAVAAALREAQEEAGLDPDRVRVHGRYDEAHGGWSYVTVLGTAAADTSARPTGGESADIAWVAAEAVDELPLHPGFAGSWPLLRQALHPLRLVVDVANVMGARPDGWWRDRAGAARRLVAACERLGRHGVGPRHLPDGMEIPPLAHWWPRLTAVVEGAARGLADARADQTQPVRLRAADGSGDDAIVAEAGDRVARGERVLVVTADRELRSRVTDVGAAVTGPRWLLDLIDATGG